jgi:hypothetical protein
MIGCGLQMPLAEAPSSTLQAPEKLKTAEIFNAGDGMLASWEFTGAWSF